jgi:hypothetical protein
LRWTDYGGRCLEAMAGSSELTGVDNVSDGAWHLAEGVSGVMYECLGSLYRHELG